jgi:hypothetical protein
MSICLLPLNLLKTHTITPVTLIGPLHYVTYETAFLCGDVKGEGSWVRGGEIRLKERVSFRCGVSGRLWRLVLGFVGQRGMGLQSRFWN